VLITENGLNLLVKRKADDETKSNPARTHIRSIDGIIQNALFYGDPEFGKPFANKDKQERPLALTAQAKNSGLKVLAIDQGFDGAVLGGLDPHFPDELVNRCPEMEIML
jgi:hypothetical protein